MMINSFPAMANVFAPLAELDDEEYFAQVDAQQPAEQVPGPRNMISAVAKQANVRARRVDPVFVYDRSAKRLIVEPVHIVETVIEFPPIRVATRRDARKASAMRRDRFYETKDGPALIVYPSYPGGSLQV